MAIGGEASFRSERSGALGIPIPDDARARLRTGGRSPELPVQVQLTDELLWLLGLYVAEGCRFEGPKGAFVTLSCDPDTLRRAAKIIERDLGIHFVHAKGNATRSTAIFVHSKLLLKLLDHLGFVGGPKRLPGWILGLPLARLKWVLEGYREGDGVHSGKKFAEAKRHEFSTIHTELKDDLVVAFARFGLLPSVGRYESTFRQRTGDRRYPFWRLTLWDVRPWSRATCCSWPRTTLKAQPSTTSSVPCSRSIRTLPPLLVWR
jgi:UDP-glucuronate decarboxylase